MDKWQEQIDEFKAYMLLERGMSANSIEAYVHDIRRLRSFAEEKGLSYETVKQTDVEDFLKTLYDEGKANTSRARMTSGIRAFYDYLIGRNLLAASPLELIEDPSVRRNLPTVLSADEAEQMIGAVDLSEPTGHRNRAILETLYGSGLRVSELTGLRLSDLFFSDGVIRVIGKGNKERLIPVNRTMVRAIETYLQVRREGPIAHGQGEYLFLNRRGKRLSRIMVFNIVRESARKAGIAKEVTPHTLRHTFATELVLGGADIRLVQEMLGHESIMTTEIYTHLNSRFKQQAVEQFHPLAKKVRTKECPSVRTENNHRAAIQEAPYTAPTD